MADNKVEEGEKEGEEKAGKDGEKKGEEKAQKDSEKEVEEEFKNSCI